MERARIGEAVRRSVAAVLGEAVGVALDPEPDEALLSSGLIDSLGLVALIQRLGAELGLEVQLAEVTLEHFDTVRRIERFAMERIGDE